MKDLLLVSYQCHTLRTDPAASTAWCPQYQHRAEDTPSKLTGSWWDGTAAQRNADRLARNLTRFNYRCWKVPHLGWKSPRHPYMLETGQLESSSADKVLGVPVENKLSTSVWCTLAAKVGNSLLGCIEKSITSRSREVLPPIYLALVLSFRLSSIRLTLMCCRAVHATKLKHKLYKERLKELAMLSLEKTRLWETFPDTSKEFIEKTESYFSQRCTGRGSDASHMLQQGQLGLDRRKGVFHQ